MIYSSNYILTPPRKTVNYRIGDDAKGGTIFLYGNPNSSNIAIFCAGYPDDHVNGQTFCSCLAKDNNMLVGLMCLPGYEDRQDKPWESHKPQGYSFKEMVIALREAVKVLHAESTDKCAKLTGIFHDWGVYVGLTWANMALEEEEKILAPDDLILFDVLGPTHKKHIDLPGCRKSFALESFQALYQIILASSFVLYRYVSKSLAKMIFIAGLISMKLLHLSPSLPIDSEIIKRRNPPMNLHRMIYMAYPYFNFFKAKFLGRMEEDFSYFTLPEDLKKTPVLYLYGTEKRFMFHDEGALEYLKREARENRSRSNGIAVKNAGHWLYVQQLQSCLEEIKFFVAARKL